jgi:hypothetical protein
MTDKERAGEGCSPLPARSSRNVDMIPEVTIYGKGLKLRGGVGNPNAHTPPERKEGDIKGWSAASRRRMREYIMTHEAPQGWQTLAVDLTVPALPFGLDDSTISREGAVKLFGMFCDRLNRGNFGAVWRLEIQPRNNTSRLDLQGIPQPHWHCMVIAPFDTDPEAISRLWHDALGVRSKVKGAKKHACRVVCCDGWQAARVRYLIDHSTKHKAEQIACGWGRHWGVVGRSLFIEDKGTPVDLDPVAGIWLRRLLRRGLRRRVVDRRAQGGIPWDCGVVVTPYPIGAQVDYMGGRLMVPGWDGQGVPSVEDRRKICRALGVAKKNVWALKLARGRTQSGFRFADGAKYVTAARCMSNQRVGETNMEGGES